MAIERRKLCINVCNKVKTCKAKSVTMLYCYKVCHTGNLHFKMIEQNKFSVLITSNLATVVCFAAATWHNDNGYPYPRRQTHTQGWYVSNLVTKETISAKQRALRT